jgi:hypothetical protein
MLARSRILACQSTISRATEEIPVASVARVMRMSVSGEADAIKVDNLTREMEKIIKPMPGFVTMTRTVCKTEWAYERAIVFNSLATFKGYMESEDRAKKVLPLLDEMSKYATGQVYVGNRVFDEFRPEFD